MSSNTGRKDGGVAPPIGLGGLFGADSDEEVDEGNFENTEELQDLSIGELNIKVRQFAWHQANANQVWPGTFVLADFIEKAGDRYKVANCLELGSATGALAIYLRMRGFSSIVTSDIDDGGQVAENIQYNIELNGLSPGVHIRHTWGAGWAHTLASLPSVVSSQLEAFLPLQYVIASDILLYVSAYPALVQTLKELFASGQVREFLMAWNRRISASGSFFDMMRAEGFLCYHHGRCVYSFYTAESATQDSYLQELENSRQHSVVANAMPTA